jgi:beta-lactamase regulating signal transducer with metallopeptidase domain
LEPSAKTWLCIAFTGVVIVNYVQQFCSLSEFQFWFVYALWYLPPFCIMLSYILASRNGKPICAPSRFT